SLGTYHRGGDRARLLRLRHRRVPLRGPRRAAVHLHRLLAYGAALPVVLLDLAGRDRPLVDRPIHARPADGCTRPHARGSQQARQRLGWSLHRPHAAVLSGHGDLRRLLPEAQAVPGRQDVSAPHRLHSLAVSGRRLLWGFVPILCSGDDPAAVMCR
ncbi:hypothetical protein HK405_002695, partial [Cladochytrium tenue]